MPGRLTQYGATAASTPMPLALVSTPPARAGMEAQTPIPRPPVPLFWPRTAEENPPGEVLEMMPMMAVALPAVLLLVPATPVPADLCLSPPPRWPRRPGPARPPQNQTPGCCCSQPRRCRRRCRCSRRRHWPPRPCRLLIPRPPSHQDPLGSWPRCRRRSSRSRAARLRNSSTRVVKHRRPRLALGDVTRGEALPLASGAAVAAAAGWAPASTRAAAPIAVTAAAPTARPIIRRLTLPASGRVGPAVGNSSFAQPQRHWTALPIRPPGSSRPTTGSPPGGARRSPGSAARRPALVR